MTLVAFALTAVVGLQGPSARCAVPRAARAIRSPFMMAEETKVPIEHLNPLPVLTPHEVIGTVMASLHRSNWETPTPYYGFEVALRFLAPTHQAKLNKAKPAGFARFMKQPHKISQIEWNEFRYDGELVLLTSDEGVREAYQTVSLRASPDDPWQTSRWKLVQVSTDYGTTVVPPTWLVEHVFVAEPDTPEDVEFLRSKAPAPEPEVLNWGGVLVPLESPRKVVTKVMNALRNMNDPYPLHGAVTATRYCSPRNRAAELSPQVFANYLEEHVYAILGEWDHMEFDDDDEDDALGEYTETNVELDVLVRRDGQESPSIVSWVLSSYEGQWLIDSMSIVE
jgi:hypothetical protein